MRLDGFFIYRALLLLSIVVYFVFDRFESRRVQDEREEFIHLKSLEFVQRATLLSVTLLALLYATLPGLSPLIPILTVVLASMYSEILAKIWLRRTL
jgi:hypothetical protein